MSAAVWPKFIIAIGALTVLSIVFIYAPIEEYPSGKRRHQPLPMQYLQPGNSDVIKNGGRSLKESALNASQRGRNETDKAEFEIKISVKTTNQAEFDSKMAMNRKKLQNACSAYPQLRRQPKFTFNLMFFKEQNVVWCPVFKASSSTWLKFFFEISTALPEQKKQQYLLKHNNQPLQLGKAVSSKISPRALDNNGLRRILIVRHPFERLVSAFRDKLEKLHGKDPQHDFYFKTYGRQIVNKYRKTAMEKFGPEYFAEEKNFGAPIPSPKRNTSELPIFWEFVQFVKSSQVNRMDEHWKPTFVRCSLCAVNYDYVIHMEDNASDERFVKGLIAPSAKDIGSSTPFNKRLTSLSSQDLTKLYFNLLSDGDIQELYEIYKFDFKLFGYSFTFRNKVYS